MKDKKIYKTTIYLCLLVLLYIGLLVSYAYSYFAFSSLGESTTSIETCSVDMAVTDKNNIGLVAGYPIDDDLVDSFKPYKITIANNSKCKKINYYLNMKNFCDTCDSTDGNCTVGDKTISCLDNYKIDPSLIRYKVKNITTNQEFVGTNPEYMYIPGAFTNNSESVELEIRLWISKDAKNEDLYVYNNGVLLENDGKPVTKTYSSKLNTLVSTRNNEYNLAVFDNNYFNLLEDGSYGNKLALTDLDNQNILKKVWKNNTSYKVDYKVKAPVNTNITLVNTYTDGSMSQSYQTSNGDFISVSYVTDSNKTVDKFIIIYNNSDNTDNENTFFIKDLNITEVNSENQ